MAEEAKYELLRELGRGNFGVVYEAEVRRTGARRAVKRLHCGSPESAELALQEFRALKSLAGRHGNVVALHEAVLQRDGEASSLQCVQSEAYLNLVETALKGERIFDPGRAYYLWLVMEFCSGGDMNRYLLSRRPDPALNVNFALQLSHAVDFLHRNNVVHRDLKPGNVLVCESAGTPVLKVADFGLSKVCNAGSHGQATSSTIGKAWLSQACGTAFYMAPEVWEGHFTAKADIFALGIMVWAMLERITFVDGKSNRQQLGSYIQHAGQLVPVGQALLENPRMKLRIPRNRCSRIDTSVVQLIRQMLSVNPQERPSACDLVECFQQCVACAN
uniref:serine/threonine-protein kinase pdik1l-like isoform X1 n=1 Tax=Myxine glutinosa TaxID=7769 RepID=UPI00358F3BD6